MYNLLEFASSAKRGFSPNNPKLHLGVETAGAFSIIFYLKFPPDDWAGRESNVLEYLDSNSGFEEVVLANGNHLGNGAEMGILVSEHCIAAMGNCCD